jgi:predicted 3-demethylubiquinone-9 3-methyltransferase (glyoxalase superfamily)
LFIQKQKGTTINYINIMQKITPFLWFDGQAEEAMNFYISVFKDSKPGKIRRYGKTGPGPEGSVMTASFELLGQEFIALNGGPIFKFSPAVSFFVSCETQDEVDYYWEKLGEGGNTNQCGWLDDKFGVTWQIVPTVLDKVLQGSEPEKAGRAMQAMMKMTKLNIQKLQDAYDGK